MANHQHAHSHGTPLRHSSTSGLRKKDLLDDAETKVDYGIARARLSLAMLEVDTKSKKESNDKGIWELSQDPLSLFMSLKAGTRAAIHYLSDLTSREGTANDRLLHAIDESAHEFEEKYQNFTAFPDKDKLLLLLQLVETKDKAVYRICNLLMSKLGFDDQEQQQEDDIESLSVAANPAIHGLLALFKAFVSMTKAMKMVSYSNAEADMTLSLHDLQRRMTETQQEIRDKDETISTLAYRLKAVTQEVGRQQVIVSQQKEIDELEVTNRGFQKEIEKLKREKKTLIQSEAMTKDLLTQAQHRMKSLQEKFEKQNSTLKPQVQQTLLHYERDMKDLKAMKQELILSDNRAIHLEKKILASREEIQSVENKLKAANVRNEADKLRIDVFAKENAKQKRINVVMSAAKMEAEKRTKKANMLQEQIHIKLSEKQSEIAEINALIKTKDDNRDRLQKQLNDQALVIKARDKEIEDLKSRFLEIQQDSKFKDEHIANLEKKNRAFEVAGMSKEAKIEMSIIKDNLEVLQNENKKLKENLRNARRESLKSEGTQQQLV